MTTGKPFHLDDRIYAHALDCVQCGLCLPDCPTYNQTGLETDSPRGRIRLLKAAAEGRIELAGQVAEHLRLCLDCRACETACPSAVSYHHLIEAAQPHLAGQHQAGPAARLVESFLRHVLPYPRRLRWAILPARLCQRMGLWKAVLGLLEKFAPPSLAALAGLLPPSGPLWPARPARSYAPHGRHRMTVGYFTGCAGQVLQNHVQQCTIRLLQHLGCQVLVPPAQVCCGAVDQHRGRPSPAKAMARRNLAAFEHCPVIITDVAGCGAMLKGYADLLADTPDLGEQARRFVGRVRDIHQFLADLDLPPAPHRLSLRATYHDPCHLAHAQALAHAPRKLLAKIPGLQLVPLPHSMTCCGSAGAYSLTQPAMAATLGRQKIEHVRRTGCRTIITANVGCALQIQRHARLAGLDLQVVHPVELLCRAYLGPDAGSPAQ